MRAMSDPILCTFRHAGTTCKEPAVWLILVGEADEHVACDTHRNDVLLRFDPKDVSAICRLDEEAE